MKKLAGFFIFSTMLLSGCATIMSDKSQQMPISSSPPSAAISIRDENGEEIFKGETPTVVTLPKSNGNYWGKKSYKVEITKPGYEKQVISITGHANGWYIGGNLLVGGLIGWFVVDPFSGAMYTLSPEKVSATLGEKIAHNDTKADGHLSIVLLQQIPESARADLQKIN